MKKWYQLPPEQPIIISNRIRFARNLDQYCFPNRMQDKEANALLGQVEEGIQKVKLQDRYDLHIADLTNYSELDKKTMVERYVVSPYVLKSKLPSKVFYSSDQRISILINEEDHIRIQCVGQGMDIESTWERASEIDDDIESVLTYAFDEQYGYLTACPTNVGTAMRSSFMLHLPMLERTGQLENILRAIGKLGITVRGVYGEGTNGQGNIYQVSNQITLGQSEQEIIDNVRNVTMQIIEQERKIREEIAGNYLLQLSDQLCRAYGALLYAKCLTQEETMTLLSQVKLGFDLKIYDFEKCVPNIYEVMIECQDANLQRGIKNKASKEELNVKRAQVVQKYIRQA